MLILVKKNKFENMKTTIYFKLRKQPYSRSKTKGFVYLIPNNLCTSTKNLMIFKDIKRLIIFINF